MHISAAAHRNASGSQSGANTGDMNEGSCGEGTDACQAPLPQHDRAGGRLNALELIGGLRTGKMTAAVQMWCAGGLI